jgi:stalled ribosome alternative rescue factor ArfA
MSKKLTEYPTPVGQQMSGTAAKQTAATRSVMQQVPSDIKKASPSPTTTVQKAPKNMTGAVKARDLKMNQQYTDAKGNQISVVSPYMQGRNKEAIVVQDQKTKEYFTINPNDMLGETLDDILDRKKHNFAKKISRKQNKLKQLIRAQKFGNTYDDPLFEIDFNSKEIINNALDAPIKCGFEAETVWPNLSSASDIPDLDDMSWYEAEDVIREYEGHRGLSTIEEAFREWIQEGPLMDIEGDIISDLVRERQEDEEQLATYFEEHHSMDEVEDYKEKVMTELRKKAKQRDMFTDTGDDDKSSKDADIEYNERQDWDTDAWVRDFIEEENFDEFREWLEEQIRDDGEAWDLAWERATDEYDIDRWVQREYGSYYSMLNSLDLYIPHPDDDSYGGGTDAVASEMEDWASNNSMSNDVRPGGYHSGKGVDNTYWRVEDDSSIEGNGAKAEIISPVYETPRQMLEEMKSLFDFFEENDVVTNQSTGLHITMSMNTEESEPNRLKLALLLNDQYVLKQFGREFNSYTRSQQENIAQQAKRIVSDGNIDDASMEELESMLERGIEYSKFTSINFKDARNENGNQLIEFRIGGGKDYHTDIKRATKTLVRYAATMQAAYDPNAFRKDYLKSIVKLIDTVKDGVTDKELKQTLGDDIPTTPFANAVKDMMHRGMYLDGLESVQQMEWLINNNDMEGAKAKFMWVMLNMLTGLASGKAKVKKTMQNVKAIRDELKRFGVTNEMIMKQVYQHYKGLTQVYDKSKLVANAAEALSAITMKPAEAPQFKAVIQYSPDKDQVLMMNKKRFNQLAYDEELNPPLSKDDFKIVNRLDLGGALRAKMGNLPGTENTGDQNEWTQDFIKKYKIVPGVPGEASDNEWIQVGQTAMRAALEHGIEIIKEAASVFDKFDRLPLQEQLELLAKVDKRKLDEAWSKKYKDSINCSNPKGFSQKAHCAGKKKKTEARKKMSAQDRLWKSYNAYTKKMTGKTADERAKELELKIAQMKKDRDAHVANEAEEPKDASARAKLDHSLRAQGHKVEKPKKGKGSFKRTEKHKGKLPEGTDFRKGDRVKHAETGERGTVLHKGNRDQVVVKFGSLNKSLSANQLRLVNDIEEADQVKAKERKPKTVKPNTGHQSKHPYQGRLVGEGAVPETNMPDEFKQIMSRPLLGSDLKGQMRAFEIVPDPAMIREFRSQISMSGKDVDLRDTFKSFASAKLHPVQKKQVGLAESVLMEKGLSLGDIGKRNNFTVFKQKISSSSPFAATDGAEVIIAPTFARKIKTVDDLKQFVQGRQVMLPLKNEPGYVVPLSYLLKTAEFGGTAKKETGVANRGELAEGVLGAATFARIAKRPGKPITYDEVLKVIQSLPKTDTGGSISKNVKTGGVTDKITLTVRLGANTYADLIDTQKLTSDALMNSYIKSTVQFVNDYTRLYANFFERNGRPDEVEIVSDGVSENTDRKTDVYMIYVDEAGNRQLKHFDISLKAGTVKQFGQVGYGRSTSPIENRFAKVMELFTQFGVNQNSFTFRPEQFQDDDGVALIKDLYKQAVELINQKLMGSDPATEYEYLDQIAQGVTYFATSNDPTVKLLQLDKGRYYVLDFKKLRPKLDGIDLEAQYAETSSGDPIVRIHDKNNPKNSGRLLQIRTKQDSNGYIRQILEKEPLLKKLISVRHVGDIER